ncbi:unnamed protein product [Rhizophagus irregularis]|uniref:Uncharacterized protein n=1 Tax=Rhizophagus irregularis TaxID=588596 RepID=A0A2I1GJ55_9GLOM|nr:hypothetical protein RhiirA4_543462 [Rhizophagus irregularis]CAB4443840.1 unnamed protein product [Rhizophagus irregularis]
MNYTYTGPCDFDDSAAPLAGNLYSHKCWNKTEKSIKTKKLTIYGMRFFYLIFMGDWISMMERDYRMEWNKIF